MDAVENLDTDTGDPELVRVAAEHGLPLVKLLHTLKLGSISLRGCSLYYYRLDRGTFVTLLLDQLQYFQRTQIECPELTV